MTGICHPLSLPAGGGAAIRRGPRPLSGALLDPGSWRPWAGLGGNSLGGSPSAASLQGPLERFRSLGILLFSLASITAVLLLLFHITRLGAAADDPQARKRAMLGILISGVALSMLGGLGGLTALFWNFF